MRSFRIAAAVILCSYVTYLAAQETAAPAPSKLTPAQAKESLEKLGLKVSASGVTMPAEQEFYKSMRDLEGVRKTFLAAEKETRHDGGRINENRKRHHTTQVPVRADERRDGRQEPVCQ